MFGLDHLDYIHFGFKELRTKILLKDWAELTGPEIRIILIGKDNQAQPLNYINRRLQELEPTVTEVIETLD